MKDFDERNFHDYGILEHLGCAAELCRIVRQSRDIVERYYGKYLKGAHTAALDSISAAVRDSGAMSRDSMEVSVACVPGASSPSLSCAVRGPCVVRRSALSCDGLVGAVNWKAVLRGCLAHWKCSLWRAGGRSWRSFVTPLLSATTRLLTVVASSTG